MASSCVCLKKRLVPCEKWQKASDLSLYTLANHPSMIGETISKKRCKITDARNCPHCSCNYYVQYSEDSGSTWLGLSFEGVPGLGGTGCPGYGRTSATKAQAIAWLKDEHVAKGRCGYGGFSPCGNWKGVSDDDLFSMAVRPGSIGDTVNNERCTIKDARNCPGYGGTSATKAQAIAWLKDEH